jgi:hypothetical protein
MPERPQRSRKKPDTLLAVSSKEVENAAAVIGDHVRVKLAPLGVPVTEHGKQNIEKWLLAREEFRKKPASFPNTLSFESWCCVTSYDVQKVDGGPHFQRLMAYLLTENNSAQLSTIETEIAKKARPPDSYYTISGWRLPHASRSATACAVSSQSRCTTGSEMPRSGAGSSAVAEKAEGAEAMSPESAIGERSTQGVPTGFCARRCGGILFSYDLKESAHQYVSNVSESTRGSIKDLGYRGSIRNTQFLKNMSRL